MAENGPFGTPLFDPKIFQKMLVWVPFWRPFPGNEAHQLHIGFGGRVWEEGPVRRGRFGWNRPVAPPESLDSNLFDLFEFSSYKTGLCGGIKQGRFVIFRFPLSCSVSGSQDTQMPGETAGKVSLSHPFCVPQMLVKTRT